MVANRAVVTACLVAECTRKPTLADTSLPDDQQILMALDPVASGELLEQRLVEPARGLEIDVLDDGRLAQTRELEPAGEPFVLALDRLAVDHQTEPLFEVERGVVRLPSLFFQRLGHAGKPKRDQPFVAGMGQSVLSSVVV